jgi:hypothetical protein
MDDSGGTVHVALFEREQLRGSKPGRGREHDHRPEARPEPLGDRPDLRPRIERPLLPAAAARVRHATLGRVLVGQLPGNRPIQYLPQRLGRLEAMPFRNREPPRADLLRRELGKARLTQLGGRLPEQPAELRDRDPLTIMRRSGRSRASLFRSALCASALLLNPPTCSLAEPRPATRYR